MFSPYYPAFTSKKSNKEQDVIKVTHVQVPSLSQLLLEPTKNYKRNLKLAKPNKIIKSSEGIRPDFYIKGDESFPESIWCITPSMSRVPS